MLTGEVTRQNPYRSPRLHEEFRTITRALLRQLRSELRYRLQDPTRYRLDLIKAGCRRILNANAEIIRFLVVSDGIAGTSEAQFAPLRRFAPLLRDRLGVVFHFMRLTDAMRLDRSALARYPVIGLKLFFRTKEPARIAAHFRELISGTGNTLVYFDGDDDVCVQWPEVLRLVDLYVKKGVFADENNYLRSYVGKSNLTDYVLRECGIAPTAADIPTSGVLEPHDLTKLHLGWSTALDDNHVDLFEEMRPRRSPSTKDVDIVCRASVPQDWIFPLRNAVSSKLQPLIASRRVMISLPTSRVPRKQYYEELLRGRICISPFGYGEVCGRDIESSICGCLLIKPDMSHIRSYPNIFVPAVTYAPVRWDYADLADVCEYYLNREQERARIADNAYQALAESYRGKTFVSLFAGVLERIGLVSPSPRLS